MNVELKHLPNVVLLPFYKTQIAPVSALQSEEEK